MNSVSKKEFHEFIKKYPRNLQSRVVTLCDPPCIEFFDQALGDYPKSIVASYIVNDPRKNEGDFDFRIADNL